MVRRDRNKINNLRDDLKKFKDTLWDLENSDGFQFCSKYADKCSKGNKFGFKIVFGNHISFAFLSPTHSGTILRDPLGQRSICLKNREQGTETVRKEIVRF